MWFGSKLENSKHFSLYLEKTKRKKYTENTEITQHILLKRNFSTKFFIYFFVQNSRDFILYQILKIEIFKIF